MTDILDQAAVAVRRRDDGDAPGAEFTRRRILADARNRRTSPAARRHAPKLLLAALFIGGPALALSYPPARTAVVTWMSPKSDPSTEAPELQASMRQAPTEPLASADDADTVEPDWPEPASATLATAQKPAAPSEEHGLVDTTTSPSAVTASPALPRAPMATDNTAATAPAERSEDAGLALYREAHHLHFSGGSPAETLTAWDRYLGEHPSGRFAPEAHFNRGILLLKMNRKSEAEAELRPFADGKYGGYRQEKAATLLGD